MTSVSVLYEIISLNQVRNLLSFSTELNAAAKVKFNLSKNKFFLIKKEEGVS